MRRKFFVLIAKNSLIIHGRVFDTDTEQQRAFTDECIDHGIEPVEENFEDGFVALEDGTTIYLSVSV